MEPTATTTAGFVVCRRRSHLLLGVLSAGLLGLCFPEPGWGWLVHAALVPATILALRAQGLGRLAWTNYVIWWAWWLIMLRWLVPVTWAGTVLLAALMAAFFTGAFLSVRLLQRRWSLPAVLALPLAWTMFELLRGVWPAGGFGWFALAHPLAPYAPDHGVSRLMQTADLFGEHTVSFLVAMSNGLLVDLLTIGRRWPSVVCWAVCTVAAVSYGSYRIQEPHGEPMLTVGVVQTDVPQSNKDSRSIAQLDLDWRRLLELTRQLQAQPQPVQLAVWPETVVRGPLNVEAVGLIKQAKDPEDRWFGRFHDDIADLVRQLDLHLLTGASSVLYGEPTRRYNSVYLYGRQGNQHELRYDKVHRVPFGEYLPWVETWPWLKRWFIEYVSPYKFDYSLTAGTKATVFSISGAGVDPVRVASPICFEDVVPRVCRRMVYTAKGQKRADALINLTNDAWFLRPQRMQHLQIAVFRSVENRVPSVRSVNTGVSAVISSSGQVIATLVRGEGTLVHRIERDRRRSPYGRVGDGPALAAALLTAVLTVGSLFGRREPRPPVR